MNYQKAKEIVDHPENYSDIGPLGWNQVHYAQGYLEAYAKAQKLVEALKDISDHSESPFSGEKWMAYINEVAEKTLTEWHKENRRGNDYF